MCCIHFHVHICSTSPFLPPSLKGKGKLHKHYAAHNCYLKVGLWAHGYTWIWHKVCTCKVDLACRESINKKIAYTYLDVLAIFFQIEILESAYAIHLFSISIIIVDVKGTLQGIWRGSLCHLTKLIEWKIIV